LLALAGRVCSRAVVEAVDRLGEMADGPRARGTGHRRDRRSRGPWRKAPGRRGVWRRGAIRRGDALQDRNVARRGLPGLAHAARPPWPGDAAVGPPPAPLTGTCRAAGGHQITPVTSAASPR